MHWLELKNSDLKKGHNNLAGASRFNQTVPLHKDKFWTGCSYYTPNLLPCIFLDLVVLLHRINVGKSLYCYLGNLLCNISLGLILSNPGSNYIKLQNKTK